jgi:hypothetical protein
MKNHLFKTISVTWILLFFVTSCSFSSVDTIKNDQKSLPQAEVVFQVGLPEKIDEGSNLYLEIIDEVTGVYFNPIRYEMNKSSDNLYLYRVAFPVGAVISYRYITIGNSVDAELNSRNQSVVCRRLFVDGPVLVQDQIYGWSSKPYRGPMGRITGQLIDKGNNAPIPDLVISAAGIQTTTSSDGTFIIENVPIGTHNVVIISKDGVYTPFQQYATVSENATTPILMHLDKREFVDVKFSLSKVNLNSTDDIRIAGNLDQLGNKFSPLQAGSANLVNDLPQMTKESSSSYSVTVSLPVGAYVQYKYTMGDGFWNSEQNSTGKFFLREFIVPAKNTTIFDKNAIFSSPGDGKIEINVSVPVNTPSSDFLFIQFNPYDWMEPIPMQKTDEFSWRFTLSSPLQLFNSINYRYCRNGDCINSISTNPQFSIKTSDKENVINDTVDGWTNFQPQAASPEIENGGLSISPNPQFITGVEFPKELPSSWEYSIQNGLTETKNLAAKWLIFSPTWSVSNKYPPTFDEISTGLSWADEQRLINYIKSSGLEPVLFPQLSIVDPVAFWKSASENGNWWPLFYTQYERFIYNYADLGQIMGAKAIIIGDPAVSISMNGNDRAQDEWSKIVKGVRARFSGTIIGAFSVPNTNTPPGWLNETDLIYTLFSPTIADRTNAINEMSDQLDSFVFPLSEKFSKPILIGAKFASNENALTGCVDDNGSCLNPYEYFLPADTGLQASLYNALSVSAFSKPWITGMISRNYYPFLLLTDPGPSPYGKPANDVLWFWFHFIQNLS